jgi:hypothetical protein
MNQSMPCRDEIVGDKVGHGARRYVSWSSVIFTSRSAPLISEALITGIPHS